MYKLKSNKAHEAELSRPPARPPLPAPRRHVTYVVLCHFTWSCLRQLQSCSWNHAWAILCLLRSRSLDVYWFSGVMSPGSRHAKCDLAKFIPGFCLRRLAIHRIKTVPNMGLHHLAHAVLITSVASFIAPPQLGCVANACQTHNQANHFSQSVIFGMCCTRNAKHRRACSLI